MKNILYILALVSVTVLSACKNQQAKTCFTYSPVFITAGTTVTFDASCTTDNIGGYTWNFEGYNKDTTVGSKTITHTYSSPGTYSVILTAAGEGNWRNKGKANTIVKTIIVN